MSDLRELAEAATPGPWVALNSNFVGWPSVVTRLNDSGGADLPVITKDITPGNAAFIAAANPTAILALLDERATLAEALKGALDAMQDHYELNLAGISIVRAALGINAEEAS